jgi:hypothetical protein
MRAAAFVLAALVAFVAAVPEAMFEDRNMRRDCVSDPPYTRLALPTEERAALIWVFSGCRTATRITALGRHAATTEPAK